MDLIASNVVTTNVSSVSFSSLVQTYRDLYIVVIAQAVNAGDAIFMRFNGDSGANYQTIIMRGTGSSALGGTNFNANQVTISPSNSVNSGNTNFMTKIDLLDYSIGNKNKSMAIRTNRTDLAVTGQSSRWVNNSAITQIDFTLQGGSNNFVAGTTFFIYGIAG